MNKYFRLILSMALGLFTLLQAQAAKPFYDNKSWIVNVAGDYGFLREIGFESKVNGLNIHIPQLLGNSIHRIDCEHIASQLTREGYGNMIINKLTGDGQNDALLRQLALENANKQDWELGSENIRAVNAEGLKTLLQDDYEPILLHNYIVLTHKVTSYTGNGNVKYAIFKVEVTKEQAFDIVANIGNRSAYSQLPIFPVKFLYAGEYKENKTMAEIAKNVPGLAVRGVLLRRHPARISMGKNQGLKKGDLVSIYSQRMNKRGEEYSKRISRARVCGVWNEEAQVNFEAGTAGNRKNGDIVVRTPDNKNRFGLMATWMPNVWGGQLLWDHKTGFARSGIIHHTLIDLGFNMTTHPGDKFLVIDEKHDNHQYKAPVFLNFGVGYGIGKTFLGFMDVMPFFIAQYEAGLMVDTHSFDEDAPDDIKGIIWGSSVRVPVGLRFSFNIGYPVKIVLEAGYAPCFGFGNDYKIVKATNKLLDLKRDGIFLNAGFIF